jgi:hypothetical protein
MSELAPASPWKAMVLAAAIAAGLAATLLFAIASISPARATPAVSLLSPARCFAR